MKFNAEIEIGPCLKGKSRNAPEFVCRRTSRCYAGIQLERLEKTTKYLEPPVTWTGHVLNISSEIHHCRDHMKWHDIHAEYGNN